MANAKANYTLSVINKRPNECQAAPPCLLSVSAGASLTDPTTVRHPKVAIPLGYILSSLAVPMAGLGCEQPQRVTSIP